MSDGSSRASKELSRKDEVWISPSGLLSVGGGKLSAYRAMAERIVDTLVENHKFTAKPCSTADHPLPGGETVVATQDLESIGAIQAERLARLYGAEAVDLVKDAQKVGLLAAEVQQAVFNEGVLRLEDYWARRSSRAWFDRGAGLPVLDQAAAVMAGLLGWDDTRKALEIENCREIDIASRSGFLGAQGASHDCRTAS